MVEYVVLPQLLGARQDASLLGSAQPWLLVVALGLEVVSLTCFSALSRAALPAVRRLAFGTLLRIDLSGLGLSHVVPGGGAAAATFRYRLLTRAGVRRQDAVTGATIQTATSLVVLVGVFLVGIVVSVLGSDDASSYVVAGALASAVLVSVASGALLLTRRRRSTLAVVHRLASRLPRVRAAALEGTLAGLGERIEGLLRDRVLLARTLLWATGNWLLDAACLWVCLTAFGFSDRIGPLLALYGAVNLLAWIPSTPGGLGIVEGVLVPALVSVGAPATTALLGVLAWRLAQYWLPIPVAAVSYLSLRLGVLRRPAPAPAR